LDTGPGGPALVVTSDGGRSWRALPPTPSTGYTLVMDFVDSSSWWAVLSEPGWNKGQPTHDWLYRSIDGGHSWALVQKNLPLGFPVIQLAFFDSEHALAVQSQNASSGPPIGPGVEVLTTSDGGISWKTVIAQVNPVNP
jgi:photosystem II stability/assembly factor-like uncharacterized protein